MTLPSPTLPTDTGQLGPGELKIGLVGSEIDISCYCNHVALEMTKNTTDSTTKLCGAVRAGTPEYTYQLTGNIDVDAGNDAGIFAMSWQEAGSQQPFTFTPSSVLKAVATGTLTIDPLRLGADNYGDDLTSDIAWDVVGTPTITIGP